MTAQDQERIDAARATADRVASVALALRGIVWHERQSPEITALREAAQEAVSALRAAAGRDADREELRLAESHAYALRGQLGMPK